MLEAVSDIAGAEHVCHGNSDFEAEIYRHMLRILWYKIVASTRAVPITNKLLFIDTSHAECI